jgi:Ricin-type beta-trefoil lectin domain-like/Secretion system C-terminal sorting domain/Bacterial Ig-like domain (group 2)
MKSKLFQLILGLCFTGLFMQNAQAQCANFSKPQITTTQDPTTFALTITINNLPAGASSSINNTFTVGKKVYSNLDATSNYTVRIRLDNCESQKEVVSVLRDGYPQYMVGCYRITNKATGKVLEVEGNSLANNVRIRQATYNASGNQMWQQVNRNFNVFSFISKSSSHWLDGNNCTEGGSARQNAFDNAKNIRWVVQGSADGFVTIGNSCGKSLRASGSTDNVTLATRPTTITDNFIWKIEKVPCASTVCGEPTLAGSNTVCKGATATLRISNASSKAVTVWRTLNTNATVSATGVVRGVELGTARIIGTVFDGVCITSLEKTVTISDCTAAAFDATKCYTVAARHSNKVMEISEADAGAGAYAFQNQATGSRRQIWRIKQQPGNFYRFINGKSGLTLEVAGRNPDDGASLVQNINTIADQQLFKIEAVSGAAGFYRMAASHSGKYITVDGATTANYGGIVQRSLVATALNQQWKISELSCPSGTLGLDAAQIYTAEGYRDGRKSILSWVSNAENADYFNIEKLDNNGNFTLLDRTNAKPVSQFLTKNYYTYTDNQPENGENTYRITLVGPDAPPQYSPLISINFKAVMDFTLSPNPTSDYVDVDLSAYENRAVALHLIDARGQEVKIAKVEKAAKTHRIELDNLTTGMYVLRIQSSGKRDVTRLLNVVK